MRASKIVILVYCFLIFQGNAYGLAGNDSTAKKRVRFLVEGAIIGNTAYSHFETADDRQGHFGSTTLKKAEKNKIKPGGILGVLILLGKSDWHNFIAGISVSRTSAEYLYNQYRVTPDYNGPLTSASESTDIHKWNDIWFINFEFGYRVKLFRGLGIQPSFVILGFNRTIENQEGKYTYTESSGYSTAPGAPPNYFLQTITPINQTVRYQDDGRVSFRLRAFYNFRINKRVNSIFVFRNLGIGYNLPWWGLGYGVVL